MAYYSHYFHLVFYFQTPFKYDFKLIKQALFAVMGSKFSELKCKTILMNGIETHCHILVSIHPSVSVSDAVQRVKLAASAFIKDKYPHSGFTSWKQGYGSFTFDKGRLKTLIRYVQNQEEHHKKEDFREEFLNLLQAHNIEFDPKYLP